MVFSFAFESVPNAVIFSLKGKMTSETDLQEIIEISTKTIVQKNPCLIFDLNDLTYINSSGINFLMRVLNKARTSNGDLIFYGVNSAVEKVFNIAKLNEIYTIYSSKEEAVDHFKKDKE